MFRSLLHHVLGTSRDAVLFAFFATLVVFGAISCAAAKNGKPDAQAAITEADSGSAKTPAVPEPSLETPIVVETRRVYPPRGSEVVSSGDQQVRWRTGFVLTSSHARFGGFSGMLIKGDSLIAVSDRGWWWTATMAHDDEGTLTGLGAGLMTPIADLDGTPVTGRDRFDAEELTRWRDGMAVSFEGTHRLHAYHGRQSLASDDSSPSLVETPAMEDVHENLGLEAVTELATGELLLIAEGSPNAAGHLRAWISQQTTGDPTLAWRQLSIEPVADFRPTAATTLPNGDVLLVQRKYNPEEGVRIRLYLLPVEILKEQALAGHPVVPKEVARLAPPVPIDNIEAVDVRVGRRGETLIYLLADDNFSDTQDTLLLQLEMGSF